MELIVEDYLLEKFEFDAFEVAKAVIDKALEIEKCPFVDPEISLTICQDEEIHQINLETRGVDFATDVLSFPNLEYDKPADFELDADINDYINPENGRVILGDIVINIDRVFAQAKEYNHSVIREYAFLIAHSMMHLFGYDHMTDEEAVIMEEKQENVLKALNITRDK